jgi:hypothetical protein
LSGGIRCHLHLNPRRASRSPSICHLAQPRIDTLRLFCILRCMYGSQRRGAWICYSGSRQGTRQACRMGGRPPQLRAYIAPASLCLSGAGSSKSAAHHFATIMLATSFTIRDTADRSRPVRSSTVDCRDDSPRRRRNVMSASLESKHSLLAVRISCGSCRASCSYINFSVSILYSLNFESGIATRSVRKCIFTYGRRNSTPNFGSLFDCREFAELSAAL